MAKQDHDDPIFAIGDVHGQAGSLEHALELVAGDPAAGAPVVFLGDYVDRGPDARRVIDTLVTGMESGRSWTALMGNHDRMFQQFLDGPEDGNFRRWRLARWLSGNIGGATTLASYGVDADPRRRIEDIHADARAAVPRAHRDWLAARPLWHRAGACLFVHAGIRPGVPLDAQTEEDLLWIREPFLDDPRDHGMLVVHGHTAIDAPCHYGNRVNLDGGAGWGRPLMPALLLGRAVFLLPGKGRIAL